MNPNQHAQDHFTLSTPRGGSALVYYPSPELDKARAEIDRLNRLLDLAVEQLRIRTEELTALRKTVA